MSLVRKVYAISYIIPQHNKVACSATETNYVNASNEWGLNILFYSFTEFEWSRKKQYVQTVLFYSTSLCCSLLSVYIPIQKCWFRHCMPVMIRWYPTVCRILHHSPFIKMDLFLVAICDSLPYKSGPSHAFLPFSQFISLPSCYESQDKISTRRISSDCDSIIQIL